MRKWCHQKQAIYSAIHVFATPESITCRGHSPIGKFLRCFLEEFRGHTGFESVIQSPCENAAREIIEDRVKVDAAAIE